MRQDLYNIEGKLAKELQKIGSLGEPNSSLLFDFKERYCLKNKLTATRTLKLLNTLRNIVAILNKPLNSISEKDFEQMNLATAKKGFSRNTINDYKTVCKIWLRFLGEKENWELLHSKELKDIKSTNGEDELDPDSLPSDEEVLQLFNVLNPKYRAFLALLEGAGLRCSEAALLRRQNVHFEEDRSLTINYIGKTGRNSIKIHAGLAHYVLEWFNQSPFREDSDPLFSKPNRNLFMSYQSLRKQLMVGAKKIGILGKRKVNPHIFRHRHATWALLNMPPVLAKKRIWNNSSTDMDRIYGHFTKQQENDAYAAATGQTKSVKKQSVLSQRVCFKCQNIFPPTAEVCSRCNIYLDPQKISEELQKKRNFEEEIAELKADMEKILVFLAKDKRFGVDNT